MKNEKLYDAISGIREEFIEEAENFKIKKRIAPALLKWGSMAACFGLIVLGASLAMGGLSAKKGARDDCNSAEGPTPIPDGSIYTVLAYNGALYNVSNEIGYLNTAGIPNIMTQDDCGLSLGNLAKTENGYEETPHDTDIELYQYASAYSNNAVVVIRDGDEYMAGLFFSKLTAKGDEEHSPISGLYLTYGITSAERIASITEGNNGKEGGADIEKITGVSALNAFYEASMTMESLYFSREEFQKLVENQMSEEEYLAFLESERVICIETTEGLKFYLNWYPQAGWLFSGGAKAYYQITEEMKNWLKTYMP